ncbi:hypothetical protein FACS1894145_4360 [Bacteroidia bacterium]|nr:hypothetical protein FACS1894145_4360 [Bacteroidia bacterium]
MAANGNDFGAYLDGWAQMMITIWQEKMQSLQVGISERNGRLRTSSGELYNSLRTEVIRQAGGDTAKINHFFLYYGYYVAAGIGPKFGASGKLGKTRNSLGQFSENPERKPKPWLSGKYWYSKNKLLAKMIETTGKHYLVSISEILTTEKK